MYRDYVDLKSSPRLKLQKSNSIDLFQKRKAAKKNGGSAMQSSWAGASTPEATKKQGIQIQSTTKMPFRNRKMTSNWKQGRSGAFAAYGGPAQSNMKFTSSYMINGGTDNNGSGGALHYHESSWQRARQTNGTQRH